MRSNIYLLKICFALFIAVTAVPPIYAQEIMTSDAVPKEEDYYEIKTVPIPEGIFLGVGGMAMLPNDKLAVSTRRGEVWTISNPYMEGGFPPDFKLFAHGLHEPLGLAYKNDALYVAQRPELTKLTDLDGDGSADEYKTIYPFNLTGNYHEYAYGPVFDKEGNMTVTLNLAWSGGRMHSFVKWRGWMLTISEDGKMIPHATGLRSPAGFGLNKEGDMFYTENQGGWIGSGYIMALDKGDFASHPAGLEWAAEKESTVKLRTGIIQDTGMPQFEVAKNVPGINTPSVWIPHRFMGVSTSDVLLDDQGIFGPFKDQIFVGDQGQSLINRVFLEKVKGVYQGAVFPFKKGFSSGVFRMCWGSDGQMFVGMTGRGWGSTGGELFGLQRLIWKGGIPFEIKAVRAMPDGFELEFTKPVDEETAKKGSSYVLKTFIYPYQRKYGSPVINRGECTLKAIEVSNDGLKVRLVVDGIKQGYIHEIHVDGVQSHVENHPVLHPTAYYTLNVIPEGRSLEITEANKIEEEMTSDIDANKDLKPQGNPKVGEVVKTDDPIKNSVSKKAGTIDKITLSQVKPLLDKYTCTSCHNTNKRQVGPSFKEISKRRYSADKMIQLIYEPKPENWPDYATPMPPMGYVPKEDVRKIAKWINSLEN